MAHFVIFLKELLKQTTFALTSSLIVAVPFVVERLLNLNIPKWLWPVVMTIILLTAVYRTWLPRHLELEAARATSPEGKLQELRLEEFPTRKKHEDRMDWLTRPETGIRAFVAEDRKKHAYQSEGRLAEALSASRSEIEEALGRLQAIGVASPTSLPGRWQFK
jgi:hypothetical protein